MASRIRLILVLLTLELYFFAALGAAGDIQQFTDPQGTIHINNRGSASKDKNKEQSNSPASPGGAVQPLQQPQVIRGRHPRTGPERGRPPLPHQPVPPMPPPEPES